MELLAIFSSSFVLGLSGAMMPGPMLTVTIGESARRGFKAGPLIVLGHGLLELLLVLPLILGLAEVLTMPRVGSTIAIVGGLFLLYMGWGMARDAYLGKITLDLSGKTAGSHPNDAGPAPRGMHPVLAGSVVSLSNPYWSIWWATVGLGYITLSLEKGTLGLAAFYTGHILSDLVWFCLIAGAVVAGRKFISTRVYRGILVACGIFLLWLGGMFIFRGFTGFT